MQILLLGVDKQSNTEKTMAGQGIVDYSPGMLGGMLLCLSLIFLLYLADWQPGPVWLNLHTSQFFFTVLQTLLVFFVCWLAALVCSPAGHRRGRAVSYHATNEAIRWMILYPGALLVLLTLLLLTAQTLHSHPWPSPLLAALLLLALLRFWPQGCSLPWLLVHRRRPRPLARTILVDFLAPQLPAPSEVGDENPALDPNR
jgi:hypothetical protein